MKILVINSGSSTIKYKLFANDRALFGQTFKHTGKFNETFDAIFDTLIEKGYITDIADIDAYGHRVVHGGECFSTPVVVNETILQAIDELSVLAPLHNPANLQGIRRAVQISEGKPQVAVFDTAFHQSMPKTSYLYPLPLHLYERQGIRRYGFHGSSHEYVANKAAHYLQKPLNKCNLITVHLGNGASICAVKQGQSYDTTMGFTPLEGLMMGTRCGDIDPSIILQLYKEGKSVARIEKMLNLHSGLFAIAGISDFETIAKRIAKGDESALLAKEMFCYRIKKYIGAYKEVLEEVDAVVFTGGIGENGPQVREGAQRGIDPQKNSQEGALEIQKDDHEGKIFVITTDEEGLIAQKTQALIS